MGLDALDIYAMGLELRSKGGGPLLEESLAARVSRQKRCREEPAE